MLYLVKICKPDFLMHKNKSLRNILKRIGPSIEPRGISDIMFRNALKMLFRLEFNSTQFNPVNRELINELCGIQSNASVKTAPVKNIFI